jgi:hypothetical protein
MINCSSGRFPGTEARFRLSPLWTFSQPLGSFTLAIGKLPALVPPIRVLGLNFSGPPRSVMLPAHLAAPWIAYKVLTLSVCFAKVSVRSNPLNPCGPEAFRKRFALRPDARLRNSRRAYSGDASIAGRCLYQCSFIGLTGPISSWTSAPFASSGWPQALKNSGPRLIHSDPRTEDMGDFFAGPCAFGFPGGA